MQLLESHALLEGTPVNSLICRDGSLGQLFPSLWRKQTSQHPSIPVQENLNNSFLANRVPGDVALVFRKESRKRRECWGGKHLSARERERERAIVRSWGAKGRRCTVFKDEGTHVEWASTH